MFGKRGNWGGPGARAVLNPAYTMGQEWRGKYGTALVVLFPQGKIFQVVLLTIAVGCCSMFALAGI